MLSTFYLQHFILHHSSMVKYILESITCSVPVLQRTIPHRVQTCHNFWWSNQIASNSVCRYRGPIPIDLFCSLIFMPSIEQTMCTFSLSICTNDITTASPYICQNHWRESSGKKWTYFVQLYLHNRWHKK